LRMENFRSTHGYGFAGFKKFRTSRQNKGHNVEVAAFIDAIAKGGVPLIPIASLSNSTRATLAAVESAIQMKTIKL